VIVAFGVPAKLITAVVPEQIVVVPEIVAVGSALMVRVAEPLCAWLQLGLDEATLTRVYVLLAVSNGEVTLALPAASNKTVVLGFESTL